MIHKKLSGMLEAQIGHELTASHYYIGIAVYFAQLNLERLAQFFFKQALEEREHAMKIVNFLVDVGEKFGIPEVPACTTKFKAPVDAAKAALGNEQKVTAQFHAMADAALQVKDYTTFNFVQWFINEQVEEEATMQKLIDLLGTGMNLLEIQEHLPAEK